MLAGAGSAALGGAVRADAGSGPDEGASTAPEDPKQEAKVSPEVELVGYCGRYCGGCGMSAFNVGMGVKALHKVNETVAVSKSAEMIGFPPIQQVVAHCCAEFDKDVSSFVDFVPKAFPRACRTGCVPCSVKDCCKRKGYLTCAECGQTATCEHLGKLAKKYRPGIDANQKAIKEMGLEKWARMKYEEAVSAKKAALHKAIDDALQDNDPSK